MTKDEAVLEISSTVALEGRVSAHCLALFAEFPEMDGEEFLEAVRQGLGGSDDQYD